MNADDPAGSSRPAERPAETDAQAVARLRRRADRERTGRLEAEAILQAKFRELYRANKELGRLAEEVQTREQYLRAVFLAANDGLVTVDSDGRIASANPAALSMLGQREDDLSGAGLDVALDLHDNGFARELAPIERTTWLRASVGREAEVSGRRADGTLFPASVTIGAMQVAERTEFVLVLRDLTQEKEAERALMRMAFIDPLTDLGNRYWIRRQFEQLAQDGDREICLLYANMDWFKRINDSLGHKVGDEALATVARRIVEPVPSAADAYRYDVCRMGGDEFAVLISPTGPVDWQEVAEEVRARIAEPMEIGGASVSLTASLGYSTAHMVQADFDRLVNEADIAMRRAKGEGNHVALAYDATMGYRASGAVALEEGIRLGLARREFIAHFQPKVDVVTGEIIGAEALVRWQHPDAGVLLPGRFLTVAEGTELVPEIGEAMLRDVLALQKQAQARGIACPVSVNVSAREFGSAGLANRFRRAAAEAGVDPGLVSVEVTEGVVAAEESDHRLLPDLRASGFAIAIDDFGVAQSSLSRLRMIPMDELKIDRSFVQNVPTNPVDSNILRAMIALGRATGAKVVVEGVERDDQIEFLRTQAPVYVQGYYYSPAVSGEEFLELLAAQPWRA